MRRPVLQFVQLATIALAVGTLIVLFRRFSPEAWSQKFRDVRPWWPKGDAATEDPRPAFIFHSPYTDSWRQTWQNQDHSHTVVVAKTKSENVAWLAEQLAPLRHVEEAVYVVDDQTAPLHTPMNKGNEAMVYLTYMIDFYDNLTDVSTFVHAHEHTWHVSEIFSSYTARMIAKLNLEKVVRDGYVNLRCTLEPGCPFSLQLDKADDDSPVGRMNKHGALALNQLFPDTQLPDLIAQPCCAQFSLSRDAIRRNPKEYYISMRDWLIGTDYPDITSGRVFEYTWHWLMGTDPVFCPDEHLCWCDVFGVCFPEALEWTKYNSMYTTRKTLFEERDFPQIYGNITAQRHAELTVMIDALTVDIDTRLANAFAAGDDGRKRQEILNNAWQMLKFRGLL